MSKKEEVLKEEENKAPKKEEVLKDKEELITIHIPKDPLNPEDDKVIVGINDMYAKIIKGEETKVSRPVYEILKQAGLI